MGQNFPRCLAGEKKDIETNVISIGTIVIKTTTFCCTIGTTYKILTPEPSEISKKKKQKTSTF